MKQWLLIGAAFLLTINATFADCGCKAPNFTEDDETAAILKFVGSKLNSDDVRDITVTETLPYATYDATMDRTRGPIFMGHTSIMYGSTGPIGPIMIERMGPTKCEVECANKRNSIRKVDVEYVKEGMTCMVNLKVTMMSKRKGFKSVVKQKYAPNCQ